MAREPLAVDFLGLGNSLVEKDRGGSQAGEADKATTLVKPIASVPEKPVVGMSNLVTFSESEKALDRENSISRLRQGSPSFQLGRVKPPESVRDEEMQSGIMVNSSEKNALKRPLEELTDADILQLTREDCRRYLKERGGMQMPPSWNKQQAVQQVFSPRHSPDPRGEDEKPAKREYTHVPRHIPSPSLAEWEHTMTSAHPPVSKHGGLAGGFNDVVRGHMRISLLANSLQAPRVVPNTASQMSSFGEEAQRSAQPSPKHAGAGVDSHLSLRVPAMQQNQPVAGHGVGFGHLLPGLNGVAKANDSSERGMAITGQQPPQMQGRNMQSSSRLAYTGGMGMQQRTAQLTIFYAGVVNVYDDISLEKAQAIMMLASNANSRSSTHTDAPTSVGSSRPFSAPMSGPQPSPASPAPPTTQTTTTAGVTVPSAALPPPELLPVLIASTLRQPTVRNVQIELPQARKASLARFLEKRKDRARSKGPYPPKTDGSTTPPREKSPTPPSSKPQSRSPSPALTSGMQKQLLFSPHLAHHCTSIRSEPNSPAIPSETLSKQILEEDRSAGNSAGRDCQIDREASGGQSGKSACRVSSQTQRDEVMEEAAS
ncbi:hypothetical protein BDL97_04G081500 [Sphagnum fallax]|nr:hypothetical protein BDL97_04G081500 [Sphagnum fallax]